ncbi:MAG: DUF255 domain-containing protein [Thermoflexales bacterium]|nr:DUF255 domain-containing protein [Thermoflexales bacterium]
MTHGTLVHWREWGDEAFAEAKAQDKPILLGISAVWCHWCHVMDRGIPGDPVHTGVYNDPQIAAYINEHFIPIRVDNDQRPDINARYNMGGWPTTCFLTPDGELIYGATYLAPAQMRQLLPRVVEVWHNEREDVLAHLRANAQAIETPPPDTTALDAETVNNTVLTLITRNYDRRNGGLGGGQKFPMSDVWALLLARYHQSGDTALLDMVVQTLIAMGTRGMYDRVAGGWFRYSTTPDWSVPHFEKMLEDHARLLPLYARAAQCCQLAGKHAEAETLLGVVHSALEYLQSTLLHDDARATYFAGSQDADEHYYMLSRVERAQHAPPFIDWRLYTDWNALMVSALLEVSVVLERPALAELALRVWRTLARMCVQEDGCVVHSLIPAEATFSPATLRGLLGDQAALAKASLDLAQHLPELRAEALSLAERVLRFAVQHLRAPNGAFCDTPANENSKGLLRVRIQPITDNSTIAEALLTLSFLADAPEWREMARQALAVFAEEYRRYREHAAAYALAVWRAAHLPDEIAIVADSDETLARWARAAHLPYAPWRVVHLLHAERDASHIAARGYPVQRRPVAFRCKGTTCSAPIFDPEALTASTAA